MSRQTMGNHRRLGISKTKDLLNFLLRNKYALIVMNAVLMYHLISRNQEEFSEYYDRGVPRLETVGGSLRSPLTEPIGGSAAATAACSDLHDNDSPLAAAWRASTTSIVETNDPELHKTATVMAMATGYHLIDYQRYVGSLRKTGYEGNIILVVAPDIDKLSESYLKSKGVVMHKVQYVTCSHPVNDDLKKDIKTLDSDQKELVTCVHPYPTLKHRWARFPLLRDLLEECGGKADPETTCGGPVLISDMRDAFFQRNPFGPEAPKVHGLQVFEEHYTIRTTHWLVDWPVGDCKGVHYDEPMLCSGTTIGTRQAMLDYLKLFHAEMDVWMASTKCCCFETNADDQSMHNYLYYSGMLQGVSGGVTAVKNRNGIVNTAGAMGSLILKQKEILWKALGEEGKGDFDISTEENEEASKSWLGLHYGMTDTDGYFVDYDGSRSFVVHQYDRFGNNFHDWLDHNRDEIYYP